MGNRGRKLKKIYLILLVTTFFFRLWQSSGCKNFFSYKFEPLAVKINVEEGVNTDRELNRQVSRFFHNKATAGIYELTKSYAGNFTPAALLEILGPIGLASLALAIIYSFKFRALPQTLHFSGLFVVAFLRLYYSNSKIAYYLFAVILYSFCLWGLNLVKTNRMQIALFLIVTVLTFWYFSFSWQQKGVCNEIFFN